jgi:cyclase
MQSCARTSENRCRGSHAKPFADIDAKWAPTELAGKNFIRVVYRSLAKPETPPPLLKPILRKN